jgi:hypothetical protein
MSTTLNKHDYIEKLANALTKITMQLILKNKIELFFNNISSHINIIWTILACFVNISKYGKLI